MAAEKDKVLTGVAETLASQSLGDSSLPVNFHGNLVSANSDEELLSLLQRAKISKQPAVVNYGAPWWVSLLFQIVHIVQVSTHRAHESCMIFQKWILEWENSRWFLGVSIAGLHSEHLTKQLSHNLSQAILASAQKLLLQQEGRSLSLLIWYHLCEGVMYVSICCLRFATWATSMLQHCLSTQMWTSVMKLQEMCATPQPSASIAMVRR